MLCAHSILCQAGDRMSILPRFPQTIPNSPKPFPTAPPSMPQLSIFPPRFGWPWGRVGSREFREHPQPAAPIPGLPHPCPASSAIPASSPRRIRGKTLQNSHGAGAGMQQRRALLRVRLLSLMISQQRIPTGSCCSPWESWILAFPPGRMEIFALVLVGTAQAGTGLQEL